MIHLALVTIAAISCPVSGKPAAIDSKMVDVNGIRFKFCSESCIKAFKEAPLSFLKKAGDKGQVVGVSVFDAVSGRKLTPKNAQGGFSDYGGVRFAFTSGTNKAAFDADPKRFGTVPDKWSSVCTVMNLELGHTYGAPGYVDYQGVRYFACCDQCFPKLRANPGAFASVAEGKIGPPKAFDVPSVWAKLSGPGF